MKNRNNKSFHIKRFTLRVKAILVYYLLLKFSENKDLV